MQQELFVKICGITNIADALCAIESGANAIGFNFYKGSKRYITPAEAASIGSKLPAGIKKIGVFVDASKDYIFESIDRAGLDGVQFSGNESPEGIFSNGKFSVKTVHVATDHSIDDLPSYAVDAFLLDTSDSGAFGGTGKTFDWNIAVRAKTLGKIILAGGLTPENVARAVKFVQPFGVDVSSGVELRPGKKDPTKVNEFVVNARNALVKG
jgi:phosphoribosylanthranilate isomerase